VHNVGLTHTHLGQTAEHGGYLNSHHTGYLYNAGEDRCSSAKEMSNRRTRRGRHVPSCPPSTWLCNGGMSHGCDSEAQLRVWLIQQHDPCIETIAGLQFQSPLRYESNCHGETPHQSHRQTVTSCEHKQAAPAWCSALYQVRRSYAGGGKPRVRLRCG
jgi:hypothetical protein